MSLGGYKFAGRFCQRGSLTDTQWILLMHKTKVDAFIASNNLSDAGWSIHMNGSPDGDYHCLDSVGNNYVTCFYNSVADRYFAIYTLCNHTSTGTDTGMVKVLLCNHTAFTSSGTRYYIGKYASNFFRMGQVEIAYNTPLDIDCAEDYITRLIPVGNLGMDTSNEGSGGYGKQNTLFSESSVMFGYAIKNDSIIMFSGKYVSGQIRTYLCASFVSGHAFSGLCNDGYDDGTTVLYNAQCTSTTISGSYENTTRLAPVDSLLSPISQTIMFNGTCTNSTGLMCVPLAHFVSQINSVPFQALSMFGLENLTTNIWGKGTISIEQLAVNFPGHQQGLYPNIYDTVANGNYLCVRYSGSPNNGNNYGITFSYGINELTTNTKRMDVALYVGWDASNPDITIDASWTEYVDDSEEPSFISDRFIDVTTETLDLNPVTHYGAIGYSDPEDHFLWFENLAEMPLNAYTTNTTQEFGFLSWGNDGIDGSFYPSLLNQTEIPIEIWLKSDTQAVPESSVIESLGLTNEVDACESGEALLRLIIQVSGNILENISFGNIVKSEFIKILYSDMCEFNAFGEDVQIEVTEPSLDYDTMSCDDLPEINFYYDSSLTDTVTVPITDCFLINDNDKITYCAFKTTIPANTIHINGSLYDKPLTVEFGLNTGLIVHESTPYDL